MKKYKGYLIDLDGTMYKGTERIESAVNFVRELRKKDIPYLFVTNNSSRSPAFIAKKLNDFDIPATEKDVFTTSLATANYIYNQNPNATIYMIGEEGLFEALANKGFVFTEENPDFVVMGIDRQITYEKLAIACLNVRKGATFISTNRDIALPTERGFLPGNGALTSVVSVSTQVNPIFIGKPEKIIMEQALDALGIHPSEAVMIGDYYDTDIQAGMNAHMDTILVHTGVTTKEQLKNYPKQPTYTVDSLVELIPYI